MIPNPVGLEFFQQHWAPPAEPVVVFAGRLDWRRGRTGWRAPYLRSLQGFPRRASVLWVRILRPGPARLDRALCAWADFRVGASASRVLRRASSPGNALGVCWRIGLRFSLTFGKDSASPPPKRSHAARRWSSPMHPDLRS